MKMTSIGIQRHHFGKRVTHFDEDDIISKTHAIVRVEDSIACVETTILGDRRYRLSLSADDIVTCLLKLPSNSLADAVVMPKASTLAMSRKC
jgi:hypothetical protein